MAKDFNNEISMERCKHGIIKLWCGICQNYQPTVTRRKATVVKKMEWWKQPKRYPGLLNQDYKLCGVKQCTSNSNNERCPQPVYGEDETLCYCHQKIEDRKIG